MVEHSGNVMVHAESGAACRRLALLDIDACRLVRSDDSLTSVLQHLPVIFKNSDLSRGSSKIFVERNGVSMLQSDCQIVRGAVNTCRFRRRPC